MRWSWTWSWEQTNKNCLVANCCHFVRPYWAVGTMSLLMSPKDSWIVLPHVRQSPTRERDPTCNLCLESSLGNSSAQFIYYKVFVRSIQLLLVAALTLTLAVVQLLHLQPHIKSCYYYYYFYYYAWGGGTEFASQLVTYVSNLFFISYASAHPHKYSSKEEVVINISL